MLVAHEAHPKNRWESIASDVVAKLAAKKAQRIVFRRSPPFLS